MSTLGSSSTDSVWIGIGDDRESGTTLYTGARIEIVIRVAGEAEIWCVACRTLFRTGVAAMIGDVLVVGIWTDIHTDLSDWVSI